MIYHRDMRCVVVLVAALGACGFRAAPGETGTPLPPADADTVDASNTPPPDVSDAAAGDAPAAGLFCDSKDPHLVACYEFEGDAKDGSKNNLDAHTHNVTFVTGKVGLAMQFGATSDADADDKPALNVQALTIEAWISPSQLPTGSAPAVIMDVDRQYALHLHSDGSVVCILANTQFNVPPTTELVPVNQWTHVACAYDGTSARVYVNGISTLPAIVGGGLGTQGDTGLSILADNKPTAPSRLRMIGMIDQLRLLNVARTPAQICEDADRTICL